MQSEPNNRMFSTRSKMSIAGVVTALAFFAATVAQAGMTITGQGYYSSNCYDHQSRCLSEASATPIAMWSMGYIDSATMSAWIGENQAACGSAVGTCMASPTSSPSSPSGKIFFYYATLPH
ncbi:MULTISPECIES: hypothetical protein [Asticcacaulis]|uniref:hypothetical protein n=1 Tax=Asticcacaulis TaxID=76890 RepID=UPI001AE8F754|nr:MULTISPECIES: hypothetical protein [Asticcacaulis]MBP2158444.1 hypothetical protein [Asticcacaulis solisilvae]MDR6799489.1 hypothetical protein [Asticcacaulis sp. BE141]